MTLTEFLLARIAEDAAVAKEIEMGGYNPPDPSPWVMSACYDDFGPLNRADIHVSRLRAECEAKRRIVNLEIDADGEILHSVVLWHLVQPYADHPDFQPEWR